MVMSPDDHSAWGPRAHPERCEDEWTEAEQDARRMARAVHGVVWGVLIGAWLLWLSWPWLRMLWRAGRSWL